MVLVRERRKSRGGEMEKEEKRVVEMNTCKYNNWWMDRKIDEQIDRQIKREKNTKKIYR